MINGDVIQRVRNGVCAVGYLSVPLAEYEKQLHSPYFQVVGTGFLVRSTTAITNRHVIKGLFERQARFGFPNSQFFISFVVPDGVGSFTNVVRQIRHFAGVDKEDIGFVEFRVVHEQHFKDIVPLQITDSLAFSITEDIGICGYPYGTDLLERDSKIYRWGPVIQQGAISAVSPFDGAARPDELLLDVRTAGGMSGSPIFRSGTGEVIGIHYAGIEATTAFGIPLTQSDVDTWLKSFDDKLNAAGIKK